VKDEAKSSVSITVRYPESKATELGSFVKNAKILAEQYGFEVD
jgi:hypothetical protein